MVENRGARPDSRLVTVRLAPETLDWLDALCARTRPEVSRSEMIRTILERVHGMDTH